MSNGDCVDGVVIAILEVCGIQDLQPDQDFYDAGVTSIQALPLLMELESRFDVTIPDDHFIAVRTARALCEIIQKSKEA